MNLARLEMDNSVLQAAFPNVSPQQLEDPLYDPFLCGLAQGRGSPFRYLAKAPFRQDKSYHVSCLSNANVKEMPRPFL